MELVETCNRDFENSASKLLSSSVFDFFSGGATDEITLRENETAYHKLKLCPKVLTGGGEPETRLQLFGQMLEMPVLVAPMAFQRLCHENGELETAEGTNLANTLMVVSTYSTTPLEKVVAVSSRKPWFQLYILKDRGLTREIIQLAESLGCSALVITVDAPVYGKRERELKNPLNMNIQLPDLQKIIQKSFPELELNNAKQLSSFLDQNISWKDISWIKSITKMPIILKGILRADDAQFALNHNVNGIVISNHGGRQLDTTPTSISALPRIVDVVGKDLDILIDGGIRRGEDVFKALALGAKAVLVGRPIIWGLASEGRVGVHKVLSSILHELYLTMQLCGCKKITEITRDFVEVFQ